MQGECLDENEVAELLSGDMKGARRERAERHVDRCEACRRLLADLADLDPEGSTRGELQPPSGPEESLPLRPGERFEHFEITFRLGSGGMGEVYAARDTKLDRQVALKVVRPGLLGSAEAMARFQREAKATARFAHPNIVTIHAVGETAGQPYVALEYLEGETLRERLARAPLHTDEAIAIASSIAQALHEAHRHGVLHRDLKPGNVHVANDGRVRVLDFGLAKILAPDAASGESRPDARPIDTTGTATATVTRNDPSVGDDLDPEEIPSAEVDTGLDTSRGAFETRATSRTGTPTHMAPEQWRGEPTSPATDIWAFGVIVHTMLAGRHPYAGLDSRELAGRVVSEAEAPRVPRDGDVPPWLADLADACMSKAPDARPTTEAIRARLAQTEGAAPPRRRGGRAAWLLLLALGATGVAVGLAVGDDTSGATPSPGVAAEAARPTAEDPPTAPPTPREPGSPPPLGDTASPTNPAGGEPGAKVPDARQTADEIDPEAAEAGPGDAAPPKPPPTATDTTLPRRSGGGKRSASKKDLFGTRE